ncbi:SpoIIE family protein phosphatase [Streptomyces sp. Tue6028]|uniref:SpoIIE family protein phosphatase n=1 Tax=Streptomyces sp. Tue6028 TaxID=2036037 RepID=UPI003D75AC5E
MGCDIFTAYTASAVIDERGIVTGWSDEARELLGYEAGEIVGQHAALLLAEDIRDSVLRFPEDRHRIHGIVRLRHRNGGSVEAGLVAHHRLSDGRGSGGWLVMSPVLGDASPLASGELLEQAFARGPCAMAIYDSDRRLLRANTLMERALGLTQEAMRGLRVSEILLHPHLEETDKAIQEVLETGIAVHRENFFPTPGQSRKQAWSVFIAPLKDADGQVNAVCLAAHDETRRYWARQRLQLLNEASASIGSTLDVVRTAEELAEVAVRGVADFVSIDLLDPQNCSGEPACLAQTERVIQVAPRHLAHRSLREDCPLISPTADTVEMYPEDSLQAECLARGRTVSCSVAESDRATGRWAPQEVVGGAQGLGLRFHLMAVPMRARGVTLGVAVFGRCRPEEGFDPDDLMLAEEITARAAVCIDNARRYTHERNTALALQHSLLPHRLPPQAAVEVSSHYLPTDTQAGVGGDWFDVIPLSGARVALVVGDVVGHGIRASATMGRLRTAVRTLADVDLPPDELLTHLDDLVMHLADETFTSSTTPQAAATDEAGDIGATCLYAVYDPVSCHCTLARAGHPLPFMVAPEGSVDLLDLPAGPPLGLGGLPFESAEVEIPQGSLLVLYTDGLIEARDRDIDAGLDIMRQVLAKPADSLGETRDMLLDALLPDHPQDDIAVLIVRTRALDTEQVATWDIPSDPAIVAKARKNVSAQLTKWGLDDFAFTTELMVSELVTNAIRHAEPPIQLRLIHDQTLICEVSDASNTSPHLRRARTFDEGGRGLLLVAQLAHGWGTRQSSTGKTIWAEQTGV